MLDLIVYGWPPALLLVCAVIVVAYVAREYRRNEAPPHQSKGHTP